MENSRVRNRIIVKIAIAIFCIAIGVCVLFVMCSTYNPSQNTLEALSSVCMDMICIIIMFILISSFAFNNLGVNRTTKLFACLILATIWALFLDFLNWSYDGALERANMTFWFTVGSLCMGAILASILSMYLYSYMAEMHGLSSMRKHSIVCSILNLVSFVISFVLALTGTAFVFEDGHYKTGMLYDVITVIPVLSLVYLAAYLIRYVKKVGVHDVFAVIGYMTFMIVGALIEAAYGIGTTYVAVAIADIFIFVMLQNEVIAQEKRSVLEWMKKSRTDELTGFYNRHAYENDLVAIESNEIPDDFVYVSVDVNSLKQVNDSFGHSAGDELLVGVAKCLNRCFGPYGTLYRTGGDEFIALIYTGDKGLELIKEELNMLTKKWDGKLVHSMTLSCGYVTRLEAKKMTVRQMAVLADKRMYEAKSEYYRQAGIERRKK